MFYSIISSVADLIIKIISILGHTGVGILMAIDSCNIPIPSEVTMPFAGFLAQSGTLSLWGVIIAGTVGSLAGSLVSYYIAHWIMGYRARVGWLKKIFSDSRVSQAERWFLKYGNASVFIGRMVPIVRTFISLPAGIARMNVGKFILFTILGSFLWSALFAYAGYILGEQWSSIDIYFRKFEFVVLILFVGIVYLIFKKERKNIG